MPQPRAFKVDWTNLDNPDNDLCKDGEDLCCNPGAVGNKDCQCLKIKEL